MNNSESARLLALNELSVHFLECAGNVFEEDEPKHDRLVLRCIHVVAQLIGSKPKFRLKPMFAVEPLLFCTDLAIKTSIKLCLYLVDCAGAKLSTSKGKKYLSLAFGVS